MCRVNICTIDKFVWWLASEFQLEWIIVNAKFGLVGECRKFEYLMTIWIESLEFHFNKSNRSRTIKQQQPSECFCVSGPSENKLNFHKLRLRINLWRCEVLAVVLWESENKTAERWVKVRLNRFVIRLEIESRKTPEGDEKLWKVSSELIADDLKLIATN